MYRRKRRLLSEAVGNGARRRRDNHQAGHDHANENPNSPYVLPEISHRLAAYCGAKGLTESAAVEAALSAYLDGGEKDNDLILRRLDRLARDSARQRRDQEVLLESFAMYVRHWFKYVPERSQAEDLAAQRLALKRFDEFVHWTSLAMARGTRLVSDVLKDEAPPEQPSPKAGQPPHGNPR